MDRRLPIRPGPFFGQMARRELILEQRLDQLATMRKRTQRYLNPPCCYDPVWTLTVTAEDIYANNQSSQMDIGAGGGYGANEVTIVSAEVVASGLSYTPGTACNLDIMAFNAEFPVSHLSFDLASSPTGGTFTGTPYLINDTVLGLGLALATDDTAAYLADFVITITLSGPGTGEYVDTWTGTPP